MPPSHTLRPRHHHHRRPRRRQVRVVARGEGDATVHTRAVIHGVTALRRPPPSHLPALPPAGAARAAAAGAGGGRYSLILFLYARRQGAC
jgi:hypothetical protein